MAVCEVCGVGPAPEQGGVTVYRQNATGQPGIWRCQPHAEAQVDPEVQEIVDAMTDPTIVRMPRIEQRGTAIVVTCMACGNYVPVVRELETDDGMRELHYDCPCGGTSCIVREVR